MKILIVLCALLPCPVLAGNLLPGGVVEKHERSYTVYGSGIEFRAEWSATVEREGKRWVLSSTSEEAEIGPAGEMRFLEVGVEVLLRLEFDTGSRTLTAQTGIRNTGTTEVFLMETCPVSSQIALKESPTAWLITGMHPHTPGGVTVAGLRDPLCLRECGGFYRRDGVGFFFGPAGTPTAYLNARFAREAEARVAMDIVADMSRVRVDHGETRWGQEVALVLRPPEAAIPHWVGMVAASHGARPLKKGLSGWSNGTPLEKVNVQAELGLLIDRMGQPSDPLHLGLIQIGGEDGQTATAEMLDQTWLRDDARRIAAAGTRFGLHLAIPPGDRKAIANAALRAKEAGFTALAIERPSLVAKETKETTFEALRADLSAVRETVGDGTLLTYAGNAPERAVVGVVDACRISQPGHRNDLGKAINDAVLALPVCGRWFAADFHSVYLGTTSHAKGNVAEGFRQSRIWLSLAGLAGGVSLVGDPLYQPEFQDYIRNLQAITPPLNAPMFAPGLFTHADRSRLITHVRRDWGKWTMALLWNPGEGEKWVRLNLSDAGLDPEKSYVVWSYWDNRVLGVVRGEWASHNIRWPDLQLLRLTELSGNGLPTLIGSNLHLSCGGEEIKEIEAGRAKMSIELTGAGSKDGYLFVHSRFPPVMEDAVGCTVEGIALVAENIWRIRLSNRDLLAPQRINLAFLLPLTQQAWFWISVVAVGASLLLALWRYVVSLRLQRQQGLAEERARIAKDLHDDLGANLAQIAYHGDSLLDARALAPADAVHVEKMRQIARTSTHALDEIVWAVDPKQDTLESFAGYLCSFAQETLADAGLKCRFDFPMDFGGRPLSSKNRHHIFLACKEALLNVIRHARATEVRIRLAVGERETELEIRDNGRGFDTGHPGARPGGGHGLESMRDRLKTCGGRCEMTSHADTGTQLCFIWTTES